MAEKQKKQPSGSRKSGVKQSGKAAAQRARSQRAHIRRLRMEQQEQQIHEENWKKRGLPMWGKTLIAVAVVLVLMLVFFRVDQFEVSGNVRYTAEEIADASGITVGDVLMGVNKTQAASRIIVKLPYVEQVEMTKVLPGTVRFTVRECRASVSAESEFKTVWLMNPEGKLLEKLDENAKNAYPLIKGVVLQLPTAGDPAAFDDQERGDLALKAARNVQEAGLSTVIRSIDVTDLDQVTLSYDDRIEVRLGDGSDLAYKLQYMKEAIGRLGSDVRGALDLSFASGDRAVFHPVA